MSGKVPLLDTDAIPLTKEDIRRRSLPMRGVVSDATGLEAWLREVYAVPKSVPLRPNEEVCTHCLKKMVACACDLEKIAQFTREMEEGKLKTPEQVAEMLKLALRHMPQDQGPASEPLTFPDLSGK